MDPWYPSDDLFWLARRRHVAVLVGKADDAVAVGDIDPFGVRPERIECDAEWLVEPAGEDFVLTRTVLDALSATNKSPFGADRMERGLASPDATISTEKPDGTRGLAPAGIGATSLKFGVDLPVGGRSRGVSRRLMPGLSCCHEPKAAFPLSSVPFPSSAAEEDALAFASTTRAVAAVLTMLCIRSSIRVGRAGGITIIDRALSSGSIHPRTNSITTVRGHPGRLATCNLACHDGRQFWQAAVSAREN